MSKSFFKLIWFSAAHIFLVVTIAVLATGVFTQTKAVNGRSVLGHPDYTHLTEALQELVDEKAKNRKNIFFVSRVVEKDSRPSFAWVYWPQANKIILLEPKKGFAPKYDLLWSRRYLDLKEDVVPTQADINGSIFLLSRDEAARIVASCKDGDRITITKTR